ncbi:MAG: chitobiase/beta-hexosaminidase C-terminal domain-containing protein [Haliscomenobacter sp.]|nr:chitobiase/beta-hexosaminidase C-terminal domain-containing protein [Haliscomenobacter sp.]
MSIEMAFAEANTQIRYTLNGQEPTEKAPLYTQPLHHGKLYNVKARVFSPVFISPPT